MADSEIPLLPAADPVTGDEQIHVVQGGNSRRATLNSVIDGLVPVITQADVRHTVSAGPVDSDGRADFLQAGTGLEVVSKDVDSFTPLQLTWGDGFAAGSKRDLAAAITGSFSVGSLPDGESYIGIWAELDPDTGTVTFGHTLLAPSYAPVRPTSPGTGQMWYPTDHRSRAEVWSGSVWVPTLRLVLGECATSGGSVASVASYAYRGRYHSGRQASLTTGSTNNLNHNIGTDPEFFKISNHLVNLTADGGYSPGDVVDINAHGDNTGTTSNNSGMSVRARRTSLTVRTSSDGLRLMNVSTGNWGPITSTSWRALYSVERGF